MLFTCVSLSRTFHKTLLYVFCVEAPIYPYIFFCRMLYMILFCYSLWSLINNIIFKWHMHMQLVCIHLSLIQVHHKVFQDEGLYLSFEKKNFTIEFKRILFTEHLQERLVLGDFMLNLDRQLMFIRTLMRINQLNVLVVLLMLGKAIICMDQEGNKKIVKEKRFG